MARPEGYTCIMAPEEARDVARRVKNERGEEWGEFLKAAAEELDSDN